MRRGVPSGVAKVTLPITPMLDLTFQLLFFFIINFHPAATTEGQIDLALPAGRDAQLGNPQEGIDPPPKDAFPADLTVEVRTQLDGVNDGDISALFVQNAQGGAVPVAGLDGLKRQLQAAR